ncbi:hypothetical protein [Peribacillus deserti]|uniref:hypothetical protein n=1 Tax=Peribacillus deserti TaxID=673318 RepID=UPI001156FEA8|nr:hypothetical protein [Peribacillus deserti]
MKKITYVKFGYDLVMALTINKETPEEKPQRFMACIRIWTIYCMELISYWYRHFNTIFSQSDIK